jgi:hypothetical protein
MTDFSCFPKFPIFVINSWFLPPLSHPPGPIVAPELNQSIIAKPDGKGLSLLVVEINSSAGACPDGIEFDAIPGEADPVTATRINFCIVWPTRGSAQLRGIGPKMNAGKLFELKTGPFFFLWVFLPVIVQVLPEHTRLRSHISVAVRIKV